MRMEDLTSGGKLDFVYSAVLEVIGNLRNILVHLLVQN